MQAKKYQVIFQNIYQALPGIFLLFIYLKCSGILNVYTKHTVSLIWKTYAQHIAAYSIYLPWKDERLSWKIIYQFHSSCYIFASETPFISRVS